MLLIVLAFAAGFALDRWLHRPIVIQFHSVPAVAAAADANMVLPAYDSLEEAGVHAIQRASECSRYYECGGDIAQRPDGKYVVGPAQSSYAGDHVGITHGVPPGWKLVADYHSHMCLKDSHIPNVFSPTDIESALSEKLTAFVGDLCTGDVHEFDPARDPPNNFNPPGSDIWVTPGRIVGKISLVPVDAEPHTGL